MLKSIIVGIVNFCTWLAWPVVVLGLLLAAASSVYTVRHFGITTDISQLISTKAPWRQREVAFHRGFPQMNAQILAVIQAPTAELTKRAASALEQRLTGANHIRSVRQAGGSAFFEQHAFLFLPTEQV